jgi:hypothetical protein
VIYVKVECSVPENHKFLKAGPAPSWLWVCGLCYCQRGLTNGFIPDAAVDYFPVKNARRLAEHLVAAALWEKVESGWMVHDYLKHNKSAEQVRAGKDDKRHAGSIGGQASAEARRKHSATAGSQADVKQTANPIGSVSVAGSGSAVEEIDVSFFKFQQAYPDQGRRGGPQAEQLFFQAVTSGVVTVDAIMAALENHAKSEQWAVAKRVPSMLKWLTEQQWRTKLDPPKERWGGWKPPSEAVS